MSDCSPLPRAATRNCRPLLSVGPLLLISSSRPGGQPANLQGLWNYHMEPPWAASNTININTEMNYWPAESTNLSECQEPLFRLIEELSETGSHTAKVHYARMAGSLTTIRFVARVRAH